MQELVELRTFNSKTFDLGGGVRQWQGSIGDIHYKDNYADVKELWKDIDLTWVRNRITRAPYELWFEGSKAIIRDKKSGQISTIELLDIGGESASLTTLTNVAVDTDLKIVVENASVRFARILKSDRAPLDASFGVTGKFGIRASDADGDIPIEVTLKDGLLTEILRPDRALKYPVRIDPTWQQSANNDGAFRRLNPSYFGIAEPDYGVGYHGLNNEKWGGGTRFQNVAISQAANMITSILSVSPRFDKAVTEVNSRISAYDIDNAPDFSLDNAASFDAKYAARTAARVEWDNIAAMTIGNWYDSPDFKAVIQEIVSRPGFVSGNAIVLFHEDYDDRSDHNADCKRSIFHFAGDNAKAPKLIATFSVGIGAISRQHNSFGLNTISAGGGLNG